MPIIFNVLRLCQVFWQIKMVQASAGKSAQHQILPVTLEILNHIKAAWEDQGLDIDKIMLWAAFTNCFFCFMYSDELEVGSDGIFDPSRNLIARGT